MTGPVFQARLLQCQFGCACNGRCEEPMDVVKAEDYYRVLGALEELRLMRDMLASTHYKETNR